MKISIKKIIIKSITLGSIVAFLFMAVMVFVAQWTIAQNSLASTANVRISDAKERLEQSEETIAELTSQLNEEFLVKAFSILSSS